MEWIVGKELRQDIIVGDVKMNKKFYGYVGYCHRNIPVAWSGSLKRCTQEAEEYCRTHPKHMTRKGVKIYELGQEKTLKKVVYNS